jgi:hypothetical protein
MKIIINERQLRTIIESEKKISNKKLKIYKETVDFFGLDYASDYFDIARWALIEMGVVESYDEDLYFGYTPITSLGILKKVGGNFDLRQTDIETLGSLEEVGGFLNLRDSRDDSVLTSLGNLTSVGGNLNLSYYKIESLDNLKKVGRDLNLEGTKIKSLGNLEEVGGYLYLRGTPISMSKYDIKKKIKVGGEIIGGRW